MKRSIRFYRDGLGFQTDEIEDNPKVIFFNNVKTKSEVNEIIELARKAGAAAG
ncbi:MAG TPA: hypothetical protein GX523_16325 [Desulfitobacterium dehalogenans]|uniref:Uncharacterized protein n=1 Tax=Desulfitobacterium dehalogenans TaxID=36854 RepID=A0A7C6Z6H1_9FIRM|nr:hypothetical protein [Desulfitobacterium dehalogenans]